MKVIFNADDFGLTKGVTDGIIKAHVDGLVESTTLMMNGLDVDYAVAKAKDNPALNVGIHLVLTWGKPLNNEVVDLIDEDGMFAYKNTYMEMEPPDLNQVEKEWRAQIEAFLDTGLPLHHIDSHHHIHGWETLRDVIVKLAKECGVPVRYVESLKDYPEILLTDALWLNFYGEGVSENVFNELHQLDVGSVEVMTHPAYIDDDLRRVSSYLEKREMEREILCGLVVPGWVE